MLSICLDTITTCNAPVKFKVIFFLIRESGLHWDMVYNETNKYLKNVKEKTIDSWWLYSKLVHQADKLLFIKTNR